MISCELFTRFHHFITYGLFFPIYKQAIHYSPDSLKLAQSPKQPARNHESYDIILSGGSVACSYGITHSAFVLDHLIESRSNKVLNVCKEGNTLKDEIDILLELNPLHKTIVMVTGFNDAFVIDGIKKQLKARATILNRLYPLSISLFVFKLVHRVTNVRIKSFSINSYAQELTRLKALIKDNKVLIFHQPFLGKAKLKSPKEISIFHQQNQHLKKIGFFTNRQNISIQLERFKTIDLQNTFDKDQTNLFSDSCHLTIAGNIKLSKVILNALIK